MAKIYIKSRYRQTRPIVVPVYTPGTSYAKVERKDTVFERRYTTWEAESDISDFVISEGDNFFDIAHRLYGDPTLWWIIADFNPSIFDLFNLTAGTSIRVPLKSLVDKVVGLT